MKRHVATSLSLLVIVSTMFGACATFKGRNQVTSPAASKKKRPPLPAKIAKRKVAPPVVQSTAKKSDYAWKSDTKLFCGSIMQVGSIQYPDTVYLFEKEGQRYLHRVYYGHTNEEDPSGQLFQLSAEQSQSAKEWVFSFLWSPKSVNDLFEAGGTEVPSEKLFVIELFQRKKEVRLIGFPAKTAKDTNKTNLIDFRCRTDHFPIDLVQE